jgi:hypothetical protein
VEDRERLTFLVALFLYLADEPGVVADVAGG